VQVARVEFHLNGSRIATDGNHPFETRFVTPTIVPGPGGNTFRLRARAFDTGGNFAWSAETTVTLVPDATPPRIVRRFPAPGAIVGSAQSVSAQFDEPLDPATLETRSVRMFFAGADGVFGTPDDARVESFTLDYRADLNGLFLGFAAPLPPGLYEVRLSDPLADRAGNVLPSPAVWRFWVLGQEDTDNDGVPDNIELALGLNPANPDSNGNGILDGQEDPDRDRLPTAWELVYGLDPRLADSNGNGLNDDLEDSGDQDGLRNFDEWRAGGSPGSADSDGDGWDDNGEFAEGTRLNDPASTPVVRVSSAAVAFLNAVPQATPAGTPRAVASAPVSLLNAVAEPVPAGLPLTVASAPASYLNAQPELPPAGTPRLAFSALVSFLHAQSATPPPGTPLEVRSAAVSYLNAQPASPTGPILVPSPVVSYRNQP
ncbi:MAG: Ig-like domain-containing protein, partial [Verrucomicrobiota bacterium]